MLKTRIGRRLSRVILVNPWVFATFMMAPGCAGPQSKERTSVGESAATTSVCEILENPSGYRGKLISIRGIYWEGLREDCPHPLVTAGHVWPSALNLAHSDLPAPAGESVPFKTDAKSWDHLQETVKREAHAGAREEIWVIAVGEVRAPVAYIRTDGQIVGGYGHLGAYPAEFVVKEVTNIKITPLPSYDYGELLRHTGAR